MKLGYSPYSYPGTIFPFGHIFGEFERLDYTKPKNCDAILLWGGTDINPAYYGEAPHATNGFIPDSPRDQDEWQWMAEAEAADVPIIGICRGAQFLCARAGGKLIQHMHGHHGSHVIYTSDDVDYVASSDHHQSLIVRGVKHKLLAWAKDGVPEIVYFPKIRGLAIQSHPEWEDSNNPIIEYELSLVKKLINKELE